LDVCGGSKKEIGLMTNESFEKALKLLREEQHNFIQKLDELEKETATVKTALQLIEEDLAAVDAAHVIFQRIGALGPDPDPEPPQAADDRLDDSSQLKSFDDPATPTKMDRNGDGDLRDLRA
jgi:hypothetical protein